MINLVTGNKARKFDPLVIKDYEASLTSNTSKYAIDYSKIKAPVLALWSNSLFSRAAKNLSVKTFAPFHILKLFPFQEIILQLIDTRKIL